MLCGCGRQRGLAWGDGAPNLPRRLSSLSRIGDHVGSRPASVIEVRVKRLMFVFFWNSKSPCLYPNAFV